MNAVAYRWNADQAAADYDAAAPAIHPFYDEVQRAVLDLLPFGAADRPHLVDLGGGSGRLVQRALERLPGATATVVDPSAAFLRLAAERLAPLARRVRFVCCGAEDGWADRLHRPDAILSTSALHHLDGDQKSAVYRACHAALAPGGVFVNGDEHRPPSDVAYRGLLEAWGDHMESQLAIGAIPDSFRAVVDAWRRRNLDGFGGPRESGDDCHETVEEQAARLYGA